MPIYQDLAWPRPCGLLLSWGGRLDDDHFRGFLDGFRSALSVFPDTRIQEEFGGKLRNKVAIEIKGGTDVSNAHNRAGEAEKSRPRNRDFGITRHLASA